MKLNRKKIRNNILIILAFFISVLVAVDYLILPYYVSGSEVKVPNVLGKNKDEAIRILKDAGLNPIVQTSRFDQKYRKNEIIFQKPAPYFAVKENRRIYLTVSGGESLVRVPSVIGKTIRDATITLERFGLGIGSVDSVESEFSNDLIVEQQYAEGREIAKGAKISLKISIGPKEGMVRVPNILNKSLAEAEKLLKSVSLRIGNKIYINSPDFLPNTVFEQEPSEDTLLKIGDSVNVVLTQSRINEKR
jgi:serine/threonine-protein kinase